MTNIHHLNAGWLHAPPNPKASCHCLVLEERDRLVVVDTGIGLQDVRDPEGRLGRTLIELAGFQFSEQDTLVRQLEGRGWSAAAVTDIVLTHADPDHAGGLADFPDAAIRMSSEELAALAAGDVRYVESQFSHGPRWKPCDAARSTDWFSLPARPLDLGLQSQVLLIPLFGHTRGHCGVAIEQGSQWLLHVGDAYYLRVELTDDQHPVGQLAALRAADDARRRESLSQLRRLARDHAREVQLVGYHDVAELPDG
ncbi:MAG: MBL fold metallo-hydrolase [Planctomyces sp.]|nr:MBL fold metallo-hydrolase [Planctomyces sp.]